jgi:hypothetical protein
MKPDGECLRSKEWFVGDCDPDQARALVTRYHYAGGTSNTSTNTHGLYRASDWQLFGVTWWLPPIRGAAISIWRDNPTAVLSLSRLVVVPGTPKNAATFLLARSQNMLSVQWQCLLTYADTWRGHTGTIYRAAGWEYLGLTKPTKIYVKDERLISRKSGPTNRSHNDMLSLGATCLGSFPKHRYRKIVMRRKPRTFTTQSLLFSDNQEE